MIGWLIDRLILSLFIPEYNLNQSGVLLKESG